MSEAASVPGLDSAVKKVAIRLAASNPGPPSATDRLINAASVPGTVSLPVNVTSSETTSAPGAISSARISGAAGTVNQSA